MAGPMDFGVQSFCFRNFADNTVVARMVREMGVDKIEVCGIHSGGFRDMGFWKEQIGVYRDAGVEIVGIGVQSFGLDRAANQCWFEAAKAAGCGALSAHFQVDTFHTVVPEVAAMSRDYGIKVAIHCHGGYSFGGQPDVLSHLLDLGGEPIGLCLDTAWAMQIGPHAGNPVQWVKRFSGRIYGVHYKDFVFGRDGMWEDVVVGSGNLDVAAFVKALKDDGFDGFAVIEYEADPDNPVPALSQCVQALRAAG